MYKISPQQYDEEICRILAQTITTVNEETGKETTVGISPDKMRRDLFAFNAEVIIVKENKDNED